jgi:hypothetical protein
MPNYWISALKEYNSTHKNGWCVYKKGSPQYNDVIKIMTSMKEGNQQYKSKEDVRPNRIDYEKKQELDKAKKPAKKNSKSITTEDLIEEWDSVNLPTLYYQYYDNIEKDIPIFKKVNQLVKKGNVVVPSALVGLLDKQLINKLFEHYGSNKNAINIMEDGLRYIISSINEEATFPDIDTDTYRGYLKHLKAANAKKLYNNLR